jgi:ABC-type uncharacterized transport system auxiliary subunit
MNRHRAFRAILLLLVIAAITACALLKSPESVTTLRLQFPNYGVNDKVADAWPEHLAFESIDAMSVVSGNRVIVFDDAKVMQFNGLRWVDTPAVMLTEQLRLMQVRSAADRPIQHFAILKLALVDFSIHLNGDGDKTALVSANAELRCAANGPIYALGIFSSEQPLKKMDAQSIAATFANATGTTTRAMLSAAELTLQRCPVAK